MTTSASSNESAQTSPFELRNIRLYIAFRIFFNGRFYYPVFTILFLDFGLTLNQFALLNAIWAATIVIMEVPSGALADTFGRKNLLVFTGMLMIVEMALLCAVPTDHPDFLFAILFVNRVISGTAEAAASGADEALAYDTLQMEGNVGDWNRVLERQMRYQAVAFIFASIIGAAVYDADLMQAAADRLGFHMNFTQKITMRFPLYLTLVMAILVLLTTLRMKEVSPVRKRPGRTYCRQCRESIVNAFKLTLRTGSWIIKTPFALLIIASGLLFDHIIRMLMTLNSQYFRVIHFPEASFGLIGSAMAFLGVLIPRLARKLTETRTPEFNFYMLGGITLSGLFAVAWVVPYFGLVPMLLLYTVMVMTGFFSSYYLNQISDSGQRATVLSFRGLSNNLAYGLMGLMYSGLTLMLRARAQAAGVRPVSSEKVVFIDSLEWFPAYFIVLFLLLIFSAGRLKRS